MRLLIEDFDESVADDLALGFWIGHAGQLTEKAGACVDSNQIQTQFAAKVLLHLLEFVLAKHAVVDEDAYQPASDGSIHQRCRHRRVDAAGKGAYRSSLLAHGLADLAYALFDEMLRRPIAARAADIQHKVAKHIDPALGVVHLGVELHGPNA